MSCHTAVLFCLFNCIRYITPQIIKFDTDSKNLLLIYWTLPYKGAKHNRNIKNYVCLAMLSY
jgi:hypothetical protein